LEPKCAYRPLLLVPIAAARFPIDKPSSPSTVASDAAAPNAERAGSVQLWEWIGDEGATTFSY
jgi:hypothetical protein